MTTRWWTGLLLVAVLVAVLVAALAGCGDASPRAAAVGEAGAGAVTCRPVDRDVFSLNGVFDFEPVDSLDELLAPPRGGGPRATAVLGRVEAWRQGPPGHAVVHVGVDEVLAPGDRPEVVRGDDAWVPLWQGGSDAGLGQYVEGVPVGTRVVALLVPATDGWQRWVERALPSGAVLAGIDGPQGLYLDDCGSVVGGLDELLPPGREFRSDLDTLASAVRGTG